MLKDLEMNYLMNRYHLNTVSNAGLFVFSHWVNKMIMIRFALAQDKIVKC